MTVIALARDDLRMRVASQGGAVLDAYWRGTPILRPFKGDATGALDPVSCGCFPLVPFCNRIEENVFQFDEASYRLQPNTDWDRHYLHGDGWLSDWTITAQDPASLTMALAVDGPVYAYAAEQTVSLHPDTIDITLTVENTRDRPMPFGLGLHPFFPLTPATTLKAGADRFWTEKHDFLPDECMSIPDDLDFSAPAPLPDRWINSGFEGWNGEARIEWPEHDVGLHLTAGTNAGRYFLFRSDTSFEPDFQADYFCFEPMTHTANGHNLPDHGGLSILASGDRLTLRFTMRPFQPSHQPSPG
jgi:aldose 1-epimerase